MFKVGDRVRVVKAGSAAGRNVGKEGIINDDEPSCIGVKIEGEGVTWFYDSSELELVGPPAPSAPTLLDQFAMAALTGMMALSAKTNGEFYTDVVVRRCWDVASEMMKAREVQK